jgi:Trypsin-like peptidase domain
MFRLLTSILLIALLEMCIFLQAQEANIGVYIYHIISHECANGESKTGTGFRLKDVEGIATALHVVVGCNDVIAVQLGKESLKNLTIIKVDFARDIAIISSSELEAMPKEGLDMAVGDVITQDPQLQKGLTVTVAGFQFDERVWREFYPYIAGPNPTTTLDTVTGITQAFKDRRSPSTEVDVIQLAGNLYPGHSGAPILIDGKVVGVGLGGLDDGEYNFGWAAQWNMDIYEQLSSRGDEELEDNLVRIQGMSLDHVFSFSSPDPKTLSVSFIYCCPNGKPITTKPKSFEINLNAFQISTPDFDEINTVNRGGIDHILIYEGTNKIASGEKKDNDIKIEFAEYMLKKPPFNDLEFTLITNGNAHSLKITNNSYPPGAYFLGPSVEEGQHVEESMFAFGELPAGVDKNQYDRPVDFSYDLKGFCFYRKLEGSESSPYQVQWTDLMLCR